MRFAKKFKIKYILPFVLLICLVFLYFYFQKPINSGNNKINTEKQSIASLFNTIQWPVYNNEKYRYSIKYSPGWLIEETGLEQCLPKEDEYGECYCSIGEVGAPAPCDKYSSVIIGVPGGLGLIDIGAIFNKKGLSLEEWLTGDGFSVNDQCKSIIVNNVFGLSCRIPDSMEDRIFFYNKDNKSGKDYIYVISWGLSPSFPLPQYLQEQQEAGIYEAIVSTFRILED